MPGAGKENRGIPTQVDEFVGRADQIDAITSLLVDDSARLITLLGDGGSGKTSLAGETLRRFRDSHPGSRLYWVALAPGVPPRADLETVVGATANAVLDGDPSGRTSWQALVDTLAHTTSTDEHTILVIDNCEHVVDSVSHMIDDLLQAVEGLTILATSRALLGWGNEHVIPLEPLTSEDALTLFKLCAARTRNPVIDPDQEAAAAEICRHVHHHPLYMRLAAGQLHYRAVGSLLAELTGELGKDRRMSWEDRARTGVNPRHARVTDVIGWSYDLCSPQQQVLLERMSVFAAGYDNPEETHRRTPDVGADLHAIAAVCSDEALCSDDQPGPARDDRVNLSSAEIEGLLRDLVDQSVVTIRFTPTGERYYLHESLRLYAGERLRLRSNGGDEERARLSRRHMLYYRDMIGKASKEWFSDRERELIEWARASWDNIFTAVETSVRQPGQAEAGVQICFGLMQLRMPFLRGSLRHLREWLERCLALAESQTPQPTQMQIEARAMLCWVTVRQGQNALPMLRKCGEDCISDSQRRATWLDNPKEDIGLPAWVELAWGTWLFMSRRDPDAIGVLIRAMSKFEANGDGGGQMMAGMFCGMAAALLAKAEEAYDITWSTLERSRAAGAEWAASWAALSWAIYLIKHGDPAEAVSVLRGALTHQLDVGDEWGAAWALELDSWARSRIAALPGLSPRERMLTGIAVAYRIGGVTTLRVRRLGIDVEAMGTFADEARKTADIVREVLGTRRYDELVSIGAGMNPERHEVHHFALDEFDVPLPAWAKSPGSMQDDDGPAQHPWYSLTETSRDIGILAGADYSNRAIAARRGRSVRTVEDQVANILKRLNINTRTDIRAAVPAPVRALIDEAANRREAESNAADQQRLVPPRTRATPRSMPRRE